MRILRGMIRLANVLAFAAAIFCGFWSMALFNRNDITAGEHGRHVLLILAACAVNAAVEAGLMWWERRDVYLPTGTSPRRSFPVIHKAR